MARTWDPTATRAIDMLAKGLLPIEQIVSHQFPLSGFQEAMDLVSVGDRSIKVAVGALRQPAAVTVHKSSDRQVTPPSALANSDVGTGSTVRPHVRRARATRG